VQRWRCPLHGTFSFLPSFVARYLRYLVRVVQVVLDELVEKSGRLETLLEVVGPSVDTVARWVRQLLGPEQERWILQLCSEATKTDVTPTAPSPARSRILSGARLCAQSLNLSPNFYPLVLQRAYLSGLYRYSH
jgi:hypothetical protein